MTRDGARGEVHVYQEQYQRVQRWYWRFEALDQGRVHDADSENYVDEILAFFQNCYHLKDWIKHDSTLPPARSRVETLINTNRWLALCADICNASKHLKLTSSRSEENPAFGNKAVSVHINSPRGTLISIKYTIDTEEGPLDAFSLATDCLRSWDQYLKTINAEPG